MNAKIVAEWLERVRRDLVMARRACEGMIRSLIKPPIMSSRRRRN